MYCHVEIHLCVYDLFFLVFFLSQGGVGWCFRRMGPMESQSVCNEIYVGCNLSSGGFCLRLTLA